MQPLFNGEVEEASNFTLEGALARRGREEAAG